MSFQHNIQQFLDEHVQACGVVLYGFEMGHNGPNKKLLVYLDAPHAITSEDCNKVAKHLRLTAAVHMPLLNQMDLEVSSPGIERRLFTFAHCQDNIGKKVKLKTKLPIDERRNFQGTLLEVHPEKQTLEIQTDLASVTIDWASIEKIRILFETTR